MIDGAGTLGCLDDADDQEAFASNQRIGIFTDSLSNITTISRGVADTPEQVQLLESIANYHKPITFYHVRAHHNNLKNIEVDKLCDVRAVNPERLNMENLEGMITPAKIKEWTKRWITKVRLGAPLTKFNTNTKTLSWIKKHVSEDDMMHCRPTFYNNLPRRQGILLAKARLYRWTDCNWFLKQIRERKCGECANKPNNSTCLPCELCKACNVIDDTGHVLNDCKMHERSRSLMLPRLGLGIRKVTDIITSNNCEVIRELGRYLIEAEEIRRKQPNTCKTNKCNWIDLRNKTGKQTDKQTA
jgi:hypothetical protein